MREGNDIAQHEVDVIVLAQGSIVVLLPELEQVIKPVLTSPKSGVMKLSSILGLCR